MSETHTPQSWLPIHKYRAADGTWSIRDGANVRIATDLTAVLADEIQMRVNAHGALVEAAKFLKGYLMGLENGTGEDDPLTEIRRTFHAPLHAKLDAALEAAGVKR